MLSKGWIKVVSMLSQDCQRVAKEIRAECDDSKVVI